MGVVVVVLGVFESPRTITELLRVHAIRWVGEDNIEGVFRAGFEPNETICVVKFVNGRIECLSDSFGQSLV